MVVSNNKAEETEVSDTIIEISPNILVKTTSPEETLEFGRRIGAVMRSGDIIALVGDLGMGKTWLAKGIAFGLQVPEHEYVNSPAFDLIHEYQGRLPVFHMDFYRLDHLSIEDSLWIQEYFDRSGVCIIEWANKFIDQLTNSYLKIELSPGDGDGKRELSITDVGHEHGHLIEGLQQ